MIASGASSSKPHAATQAPRTTPAQQPQAKSPARSAPKPQPSQPKDTFEAGRSRAPAHPAAAPQKAGQGHAAPTETRGEKQASDAVKVKTVGQERAALEQGGQDAHKTNTQAADRVF